MTDLVVTRAGAATSGLEPPRPVDVPGAIPPAAVVDRRSRDRFTVLDLPALAAASWAVALAAGWRGPLVGVVAGITIATLPGLLVVARVQAAHRAMAAVVTIAVSIATWSIVAHVLLTIRWWPPTAPVALASALSAAAAVRCRATSKPMRPLVAARRATTVGAPTGIAVIAAVALWVWSLPRIDLDALGDWGFVTVAPVTWFVALGLGVGITASAIATRRPVDPRRRTRRFVAGVGVTLVVLYATFPAITETIRYPWSYKHLGVIRLLDATGRFHPDIDIYNTFSGMFGLGALVSATTGVDPASYAAWAQLVGSCCIALAVWTFARRVGGTDRVAHLATVLYVLTDWVGQNYFAPQMIGWFAGVTVVALALEWFGPRREATPGDPRSPLGLRLTTVVLVFVGLLMTHPLTPAAVLLVLGLAVVMRQVRSWRLIAALAAALLLWAVRALPYFTSRGFDLGFGGSVTANASGNVHADDPPPVVELVGMITRGFSLAVWALAVVGLAVGLVRRRRIGIAAAAAFGPFLILGAQSYGGEAIYRVFLYSLPGMVALVAIGLVGGAVPATPPPGRGRVWLERVSAGLLGALLFAIAAGFVVVHYGREQINYVAPQEVAIAELLEARPEAEFIGAQFASRFPASSTVRYPMIQVDDTWTPTIEELLDPNSDTPLAEQVDAAATWLTGLTDGAVYVVVTPGMLDGVRVIGRLPITTADQAAALLSSSERYEAVARVEDSWLFRVVPDAARGKDLAS